MFDPEVLLEEREEKFLDLISQITDSTLDRYEELLGRVPWMMEAWISLDRCVSSSDKQGENGSTILHISIT